MSTSTRPSKQSASVIAASVGALGAYKKLADGAIAQTCDESLRRPLNADVNSIAVIMKHMAGNMISRWTDFLSSDGEKPDRNRDGEFVDEFPDRASMLAFWERGWRRVFDTLESLSDADLFKTITIRGEPHHVIDAIQRQIAHYGYHVGQIVMVARVYAGDNWKVLTIPRGGSQQFNDSMRR